MMTKFMIFDQFSYFLVKQTLIQKQPYRYLNGASRKIIELYDEQDKLFEDQLGSLNETFPEDIKFAITHPIKHFSLKNRLNKLKRISISK